MGNHNYSNFFNKKNNNNVVNTSITNNEVNNEVDNEEVQTINDPSNETVVETPVVEDAIEENKEFVNGTVKCKRLNVRKEPSKDAEVLCIIEEQTELQIDLKESTDAFFKVQTASGIDGYCMKEYINIK